MKAISLVLVLVASSVSAARLGDSNKGSAIGAVITKLKKMLEDSKKDWKADKAKFEAFVEYCEKNEAEKTKSISDATETIAVLGSKIEQLQGSTGSLSTQTADLKADMAENKEAQDAAVSLRGKENKAYEAEQKDLKAAVGQMNLAIETLAAIGADQTAASRDKGDNAKFMGDYKKSSLVSIQSTVRQALVAANAFLAPEKQQKLTALIQAPFTGTYTSQSGAIIGILKDMRDTFKTNLAESEATEKASKAAHDKFMKNKGEEFDKMKKSYDTKQADMGTNDGDLSTKKTQLTDKTKQKGEDEDFLGKLKKQCVDKTDQYNIRKKFAANEEIALTKALAILDNDVANEDFSAKTFLQVSASPSSHRRAEAAAFLQGNQKESPRVRQVLLLLQAGNPFSVVLKQIDNMVKAADDEQKVDDEEKAWCTKTNKNNKKDMDDVNDDLDTLDGEITKLKNKIGSPKTGLKDQIAEAQKGLKDNLKTQGDETKDRREANLEYQKDASTLNDVIETIAKAVDVLKSYYDSLDNEQIGLIQIREDPAPPDTFKGDYKGQNDAAKVVFGLLEDITKSTTKEINSEHDAEKKGQHDYEDSMKTLVDAEADYEKSIVDLNGDLAKAEKDLEAKYEEETSTEKQKKTIERYIAKLKPGCDFVLDKFDARKKSRAAEKKALEGAKTKLTGSPSYKAATKAAEEAALGKCKATCLKDKAHVKCKSCLAGTSIPGYCAGHKGTAGC